MCMYTKGVRWCIATYISTCVAVHLVHRRLTVQWFSYVSFGTTSPFCGVRVHVMAHMYVSVKYITDKMHPHSSVTRRTTRIVGIEELCVELTY